MPHAVFACWRTGTHWVHIMHCPTGIPKTGSASARDYSLLICIFLFVSVSQHVHVDLLFWKISNQVSTLIFFRVLRMRLIHDVHLRWFAISRTIL